MRKILTLTLATLAFASCHMNDELIKQIDHITKSSFDQASLSFKLSSVDQHHSIQDCHCYFKTNDLKT